MRILVLGASGMIGSTIFRVLGEGNEWDIHGTVRNGSVKDFFPGRLAKRLVAGVDVEHPDALIKALDELRPDVVINCAGLTKHQPHADDPLVAVPINGLMPHRLARLCNLISARLVHISTDCVFSGKKGAYTEGDFSDADDVYGKSKAMGEVVYPHTITLRTSTIGHELQSKHGLLDWFLSQESQCLGYSRAIFSGLPTVIFAQLVRDIVIPHPQLFGLYHIAAEPISKYDLLKLIARVYKKPIEIVPDTKLVIDRSLDASRFREATGYVAPTWDEMIMQMHADRNKD